MWFLKPYLLNLACLFLILFIGIESWELYKTPPVYFNSYTHLKPRTAIKEDVVAMITRKAIKAGINPIKARRIAFCESSNNPLARNKYSSASGIFAFTRATWLEGIKKRKLNWTAEDVFDAEKNIDMAIWLYKKYGDKPWFNSNKCWK